MKSKTQQWLDSEELKTFTKNLKTMPDRRLAELYRLVDPVGHELGRLSHWNRPLLDLQSHLSAYSIRAYEEICKRSGYDKSRDRDAFKAWFNKAITND